MLLAQFEYLQRSGTKSSYFLFFTQVATQRKNQDKQNNNKDNKPNKNTIIL